jgi:D-alanyl-D-alanine carboxypeptidase
VGFFSIRFENFEMTNRRAFAFALALTICGVSGDVRPARATPTILAAASSRKLQSVLNDARAQTGSPGAAAAIMVNGKIVWQGVSGTADLRTRRPVSNDTLFSLASVTKMFVATMAMRLAEEGRLRLDDTITQYVPAYVPDTRTVTIRELLGHTSGYPDNEDDPVIARWLDDPNFKWRRDHIMQREGDVTFKPGTKFSYCNSCYVMLGAVIEKAGGSTIGASFNRLIVSSLGLSGAADFDRLPALAPRIARGYDLQKGKLVDTFAGAHDLGVPTGVWGVVWTDGGIAASATGVARFTDALFGGRVVRPKSLAQMMHPGPDHSYGLGTYRMAFDSHEWQGHSGFYYGFTTQTWYDFSRRLTITVLTNRTDDRGPASAIWHRLANAYDRLGKLRD